MRRGLICLLAACGGSATPDATPGGDDDPGGSCSAIPATESGDGTYYDADGTGNCSFDASPDDLLVAAMNAPDYMSSAWCGACLEVTGPKGTVTVRVVDQCPGCRHGDLDLSMTAFAKIAEISAGRVPISWHEVDCPVTGPIEYRFKEGSNPFYTAIQIRNARYPIESVEYRDDTGAWTAIERVSYNFFIASSGLGEGPYALRVTDQRGHVLEDDAVPFAEASTQMGAAQFPSCP